MPQYNGLKSVIFICCVILIEKLFCAILQSNVNCPVTSFSHSDSLINKALPCI